MISAAAAAAGADGSHRCDQGRREPEAIVRSRGTPERRPLRPRFDSATSRPLSSPTTKQARHPRFLAGDLSDEDLRNRFPTRLWGWLSRWVRRKLAAAQPAGADDPRTQARNHLGPLYLTPALQLRNIGVDTNVFNTSVNPKSDFTFTVGPQADVWLPIGRRGAAKNDRLAPTSCTSRHTRASARSTLTRW